MTMIMTMLDDFMIRAFLGGFLFCLMAAPLGCFVLWQRLSFFGDTLSHAALIGVALGFALGLLPSVAIFLSAALFALILFFFYKDSDLSNDTLLAILSQGALASGLIALSFLQSVRFDLSSFLFGDILSLSSQDVLHLGVGALVVCSLLFLLWRPLLLTTIHKELADVEGVQTTALQILFFLLLSLTIALALKMVGALLLTALLILPAACSRFFSKSPQGMVGGSLVFSILFVSAGLIASSFYDLPTTPSIAFCGFATFCVLKIFSKS